MATSKRSKTNKLKDMPIKGSTFGEVLGAVLKVNAPKAKKAAKRKKK